MKQLILGLGLLCGILNVKAQVFYDNFTRGSDPGPIAPWSAVAGTWTTTGGTMRSGPNTTFSYGNAVITNRFTNCTVQARVQFPVGAFGGGVGGRLDTNTGAHYAAWVYPETSTGGSNLLRLIKFQNYSSFGYLGNAFTYMAQANLAAVGTNIHLLRLDFQTNRIVVFFDGAQMISTNDVEAQYYTNGAVSLDMWTDAAAYF